MNEILILFYTMNKLFYKIINEIKVGYKALYFVLSRHYQQYKTRK